MVMIIYQKYIITAKEKNGNRLLIAKTAEKMNDNKLVCKTGKEYG